jgi:hypothetical protein
MRRKIAGEILDAGRIDANHSIAQNSFLTTKQRPDHFPYRRANRRSNRKLAQSLAAIDPLPRCPAHINPEPLKECLWIAFKLLEKKSVFLPNHLRKCCPGSAV